ncbi:MAG: helix-turn-helix domain-containing protein [Candidatus Omnitrophica bacterium]|nr:helix-turn-helix domain-containing protein [Candidatus Omnitrophota bacterium]
MTDKLLTLKEAADTIGVSEKEVQRLVDDGELSAYQIGGVYLRFKEEQVFSLRAKYSKEPSSSPPSLQINKEATTAKGTIISAIKDFFYFNDFYIISIAVAIGLFFIILKSIR